MKNLEILNLWIRRLQRLLRRRVGKAKRTNRCLEKKWNSEASQSNQNLSVYRRLYSALAEESVYFSIVSYRKPPGRLFVGVDICNFRRRVCRYTIVDHEYRIYRKSRQSSPMKSLTNWQSTILFTAKIGGDVNISVDSIRPLWKATERARFPSQSENRSFSPIGLSHESAIVI